MYAIYREPHQRKMLSFATLLSTPSLRSHSVRFTVYYSSLGDTATNVRSCSVRHALLKSTVSVVLHLTCLRLRFVTSLALFLLADYATSTASNLS